MLKRVLICICLFFLMPAVSFAIPPMPYKIGGTVTVDGAQITQETNKGYTFRVTRPDGSEFLNNAGNSAEDMDGLNKADFYIIDIPIYDETRQPSGAVPGDDAVIRVYRNGVELPVTSPAKGAVIVGKSGTINQINISVDSVPTKKR